jgi:hypothetical protein
MADAEVRMQMRSWVPLGAVVLLGGCGDPAGPAGATLGTVTEAATTSLVVVQTVVMSGLENPRGLAFSPDGVLYVAEAGYGGPGPCISSGAGAGVCYGPTGSVSRLPKNRPQERYATGMPSLVGPNQAAQAGPNDIAFLGTGGAHVTIGLQQDPTRRSVLGEVGMQFGRLVHVSAGGDWRFKADISAYEAAHNPDGRLNADGSPNLDSNPYGLLAFPGAHVVTDAGANALLEMKANGAISLLATFHSRGSTPMRPSFAPAGFAQVTDAVPTSVVVGPDGALYVAELTGVPFTDTRANIYRVVRGDPTRHFLIDDACITGFKTVMDIAFDPAGVLYVLQHSTGLVQQGGLGILIRITPDPQESDICASYRQGTRTIVHGALSFPTSVAIGPDGALYVTNNARALGAGEVLRLVLQ